MPPRRQLLGGLESRIRRRGPQRRIARLQERLGVDLQDRRPQLSREQIEATAREEGPGILARIGDALALSGDVTRGVLAGRPGERVEARELLSQFGVEPQLEFDASRLLEPSLENVGRIASGIAVLGADIFTDPTTLLGGIGQLGKAGRAVQGAQQAVGRARDIARLGRNLVPRGGRGQTSQAFLDALGPLGRDIRERAARGESLTSLARGETQRASQLLRDLPERLRPADLFRGDQPLLGRLRQRAAPGLRDRELLTASIPFTQARGRIPIPRVLEQAAIQPVGRALGSARRGLQRFFGRGIPERTRAAFRAGRIGVQKSAEEIGQQIGARADELVAQRTLASGGSLDDAADALRDEFQVDIRNAREGGEVTIPQNEREFAEDLNRVVNGATEAQIATGARNDALIEDYAERILTPAGREAIRVKRLGNEFRSFMNQRARIHEGSQVRRRDYLRDRLTTDVNEFFSQNMPELQGQQFFNLNPAVTVEAAIKDRGLSVLHSNLASSLVEDFAGMAGRAGDVPLPKFLAEIGIKRFRNAQWKTNSVEEVTKALRNAGIDVTRTMPKEIAKEFGDILGVTQKTTPEGWRKFLQNVYDPIASVYRTLVTTPFPGFHMRNATGNVMLNFLAGVKNPKHYFNAINITRRGGNLKEFERLQRLGVIRAGQSRQILEEAGVPAQLAAGTRPQRALARIQRNVVTRGGAAMGDFVENSGRVAHYLSKKAEGFTDLEAVESVNKFLFNYGKDALSPLERGVGNRLMFFYRWNRYAMPLMFGQLFENPRRFAALGKFTTQPAVDRPAGVPEFLREAAGVPQSVDPETGETTFTGRFGSPFEVFGLIDPTGGAPGITGQATKAGREGAQLLIPPLRAALEVLAGEDFFTGRDIADLDRGSATGTAIGNLIGQIPGFGQLGRDIGEEVPTRQFGVTKNRQAPALNFLLRNLPTSRITSSLARLIDAGAESAAPSGQLGRKTLPEELLRFVGGINLNKIDTGAEAIRRFQRVQRAKAEELRLRGRAGQLEIPFLQEAGRRDPEARRVFELLRSVRGRKSL